MAPAPIKCPQYAATYPIPVAGYQQYTIPSLIKEGEVLVMCGIRNQASTSGASIYYSTVTMLLPTLTLG
ncbi:MAG: hypothetical protein ABI488_14850 [Polyangiaceae bacterium]